MDHPNSDVAKLMIEKLEELKEYARTHSERTPNPFAYRSSIYFQRAWKRLRTIEKRILREAYWRDISLDVDGESVKFRQLVDASDRSSTNQFQIYLSGKFSTMWCNALDIFTELHEKWNKLMSEIIKENI